MTHKRQVIGDRTISNPRVRIQKIGNPDRPTEVTLSMETCSCGNSYARPGVGYRTETGWICKRCSQMHTTHPGKKAPPESLHPDPDSIREFDARVPFTILEEWLTAEDAARRLAAAA